MTNDYKNGIAFKDPQEKLKLLIDSKSSKPFFSKFDEFHHDLKFSDKNLDFLEGYLVSFYESLNSLSSDMETLEARSRSLNQKLIVFQNTEKKLAPIVEALIIPPSIVRQISDGEVSLQWLLALKYILQRHNELEIMLKERGGFVAIKAAEQQLSVISRKAVERIRDFLGSKIKALRVFGVNSQAIQKDLLMFRDLYTFLKIQHSSLAKDILKAYINTMSWYYFSYFYRYTKSLEKINIHHFQKNVLLGSDEGSKRGLLFSRSTLKDKTFMQVLMDSVNLGNRANIISSDDPSVLLAHVAENSSLNGNNHLLYYIETGFRSLNFALLDNVTVEYQFLQDFFGLKAGESVNKVFESIFQKTFSLGQAYTNDILTNDSYDAFGILICIRLCRKLEFELQHRKVPVMEDYLNLQLLNLWPKFQLVMDAHCESLHRSSSRSSLHSYISDSSTGDSNGSLGSAALVPHPLTQAFSSFLAGILTLCENEDSISEPVARSVLRLRNEFESVLTKLSTSTFCPNGHEIGKRQGSTKQEKFLYNNYFLVSTILSDLTGPLANQEKDHFKLLTQAYEPN